MLTFSLLSSTVCFIQSVLFVALKKEKKRKKKELSEKENRPHKIKVPFPGNKDDTKGLERESTGGK